MTGVAGREIVPRRPSSRTLAGSAAPLRCLLVTGQLLTGVEVLGKLVSIPLDTPGPIGFRRACGHSGFRLEITVERCRLKPRGNARFVERSRR